MLAKTHPHYPYVSEVMAYFDAVVEHGTDQQLFIASYLQGHFSLVISQVVSLPDSSPDNNPDSNMAQIDKLMRASLKQAFSGGELSLQDQQQTLSLWGRLYQRKFSLTS